MGTVSERAHQFLGREFDFGSKFAAFVVVWIEDIEPGRGRGVGDREHGGDERPCESRIEIRLRAHVDDDHISRRPTDASFR